MLQSVLWYPAFAQWMIQHHETMPAVLNHVPLKTLSKANRGIHFLTTSSYLRKHRHISYWSVDWFTKTSFLECIVKYDEQMLVSKWFHWLVDRSGWLQKYQYLVKRSQSHVLRENMFRMTGKQNFCFKTRPITRVCILLFFVHLCLLCMCML